MRKNDVHEYKRDILANLIKLNDRAYSMSNNHMSNVHPPHSALFVYQFVCLLSLCLSVSLSFCHFVILSIYFLVFLYLCLSVSVCLLRDVLGQFSSLMLKFFCV